MMERLKKDAEDLTPKLIEWRRDFHRHPEIAFQEKRTSSVISQFLEGLGIPVKTLAKTGLRAELEGMPGGKTVALRADMDALPLKEEGEKEYISENPGATHACGHDGRNVFQGMKRTVKQVTILSGDLFHDILDSDPVEKMTRNPRITDALLKGRECQDIHVMSGRLESFG